jgi:uncharacterized protein YjdB
VIIPETVIKVGDEAFSGCTNLKEVVEEDGGKTLVFGNNVFDKAPVDTVCQGRENEGNPYNGKDTLTSLTIGDKVDSIKNSEFAGCQNISELTVLNLEPPTLPDDAFDSDVYKNATLRVPDGKVDDYKAADGWKNFFTILGQNEVPVTSLTLNLESAEIEEGSSLQLTATVTPDNATDKSVTWSSSDASIATVDSNGKVTGVKVGTATITATTANGLTATCELVVKANVVECYGISLNLESAEVEEGSCIQLAATVTPDNATDKSVSWSTSDASIANVDSKGKVTGMKAGTAAITATTANGLTATCTVTVKAKAIEPDKPSGPEHPEQPGEGDDSTAIDSVGGEGAEISVTVDGAAIVLKVPEGATVEVYTITGTLVRSTREHRISGLSRGVYVVRVAGKVFKVSI